MMPTRWLQNRTLRLGLLLWVAGMIGAVVLTLPVLPQLLSQHPLPAPLWLLTLASLAQSAVLIGLAVWAGTTLSAAVGLRAPVFEAALASRAWWPELRRQALPGLIAAALGGALLAAFSHYAPAALAAAQERLNPPLLARVLYGGVTEELLLRWGLMTVVLWLLWRFVHRRRRAPSASSVWFAIVFTALLFGVGHLPAAVALIDNLTPSLICFVIGANTIFGVLFGYLFWRYGLEAAMLAHGGGHAVAYCLT